MLKEKKLRNEEKKQKKQEKEEQRLQRKREKEAEKEKLKAQTHSETKSAARNQAGHGEEKDCRMKRGGKTGIPGALVGDGGQRAVQATCREGELPRLGLSQCAYASSSTRATAVSAPGCRVHAAEEADLCSPCFGCKKQRSHTRQRLATHADA